MKILFLSHYFPPEVNAPASRTYEHCRAWVARGHEVTVITCAPNHPKGMIFDGYKNNLIYREEINGINVIRLWTFVTPNEGVIKRTLNYLSFMLMSILVAPFLGRADVVLSTSPQFFNGLAGYFVSRLKAAKWVLEIRDLWPESIIAVGAINNRRIIGMLERIEHFAYRKADRIVTVTQSFKRYMTKCGISEHKVDVIYNGADFDLFNVEKQLTKAAVIENLALPELPPELSDKFIASYVGTHGMAHHLETLLDAAERLRERTDIVFLMVGDGAEKARLQKIKQEKNLTNVIMLDQLPKAKMPAIWTITDASLVLLKRSDLFKTVIPSKIFESMAMSKPIILGVEGEVSDLVNQGNCGLVIEPENSELLANAVTRLADNSELKNQLGINGSEFVKTRFNRRTLARSFENMLMVMVEDTATVDVSRETTSMKTSQAH